MDRRFGERAAHGPTLSPPEFDKPEQKVEQSGGPRGGYVHEKISAAAAPRKPKKGAVSSPLNADGIFLLLLLPLVLRREIDPWGALAPRPPCRGRRRHERSRFRSSASDWGFADLI